MEIKQKYIMTEKGTLTNYVLWLIDYSSREKYSPVYKGIDRKLMFDFVRTFYPNAVELPVGSDELKEFYNEKNADGYPNRPYLILITRPTDSQSYTTTYAVNEFINPKWWVAKSICKHHKCRKTVRNCFKDTRTYY